MKTKRMFAALSALMMAVAMTIPASAVPCDFSQERVFHYFTNLDEPISSPNWNGDAQTQGWIVATETICIFEGIAFTCTDIDTLLSCETGGLPVVWSDGRCVVSGKNDIAGQMVVTPLTGMVEAYNKFYADKDEWDILDDRAYSVEIPEVLKNHADTVYVAYTYRDDVDMVEALQNEPSVQVLGAISSKIEEPYYLTSHSFSLKLEEDVSLTAADFGVYSKYMLQSPDGVWYSDTEAIEDFETVNQIRKAVCAIDGVVGAAFPCFRYDNDVASDQSHSMIFDSFIDAGDITLDGKSDVRDAVLMARVAVGDKAAATTQLGLDAADMNKDGAVNDLDLTMLLRKLAKLD